MPLSLIQRAKRAFVSVLLKLAFDYGVAVDINRESDDKAVSQCYRRVVKKVHPDKGGNKKKFQTLQVRERPPAQKTRRTANGKTTRIDSHDGSGCVRYRGTG